MEFSNRIGFARILSFYNSQHSNKSFMSFMLISFLSNHLIIDLTNINFRRFSSSVFNFTTTERINEIIENTPINTFVHSLSVVFIQKYTSAMPAPTEKKNSAELSVNKLNSIMRHLVKLIFNVPELSFSEFV